MRALATLLLILNLSACAAPPVAIETPEVLVRAGPQQREQAQEAAEIAHVYVPLIEQALDIEIDRPHITFVDRELEGDALATCSRRFGGTTITVGTEAIPWLRTSLVHELVHYGAFESRWIRLPHCLHEGLAYWLQLQLVELQGASLRIPAPDEATLRDVLSFTGRRHDAAEDGAERNTASVWVVSKLGLGRLRDLVERGEREGRAVIPPEWIEAALPGARDEDVQLLDFMQVNYRDAAGAVIASRVGSFSSPWVQKLPPGAKSMGFVALAVPQYSGPRMMFLTHVRNSTVGIDPAPSPQP